MSTNKDLDNLDMALDRANTAHAALYAARADPTARTEALANLDAALGNLSTILDTSAGSGDIGIALAKGLARNTLSAIRADRAAILADAAFLAEIRARPK